MEPEPAEVLQEISDPSRYDEIVFCGYGEPTVRLEEMLEIARALKACGAYIRLNTDGHAALIHGRDILPELKGLIDEISVSLNAANADEYVRLMRPEKGAVAFTAVQQFIRRAVELGFDVTATAVAVPDLQIEPIRELAESLGAKWRTRRYNRVG
jgi:TatD DNase family protein